MDMCVHFVACWERPQGDVALDESRSVKYQPPVGDREPRGVEKQSFGTHRSRESKNYGNRRK
jgi:hypothetical protein